MSEIECPICFMSYDDNTRQPVRTFCRCRQTLCMTCLTNFLQHSTYCPWDRTRWSGRHLLSKFLESTPQAYLQILLARDNRQSNSGSCSNNPVNIFESPTSRSESSRSSGSSVDAIVADQHRILLQMELERGDHSLALTLQQREREQESNTKPIWGSMRKLERKRKRGIETYFSIRSAHRSNDRNILSVISSPNVSTISRCEAISSTQSTSKNSSNAPLSAFSLLCSAKQQHGNTRPRSNSSDQNKLSAKTKSPRPTFMTSTKHAGMEEALVVTRSLQHAIEGRDWTCPSCSFANCGFLPFCEVCAVTRT
jgi:hypothetical protein